MLKNIYSCDLCKEELKPEYLKGLRFSNMHEFKIGDARSTDGTHICMRCLDQLGQQIAKAAATYLD